MVIILRCCLESALGLEESCAASKRRPESQSRAQLANRKRTAPPVRPSLSFRQGQPSAARAGVAGHAAGRFGTCICLVIARR